MQGDDKLTQLAQELFEAHVTGCHMVGWTHMAPKLTWRQMPESIKNIWRHVAKHAIQSVTQQE